MYCSSLVPLIYRLQIQLEEGLRTVSYIIPWGGGAYRDSTGLGQGLPPSGTVLVVQWATLQGRGVAVQGHGLQVLQVLQFSQVLEIYFLFLFANNL